MTRAERARRTELADGMTAAQQRRAVLIAQDVLRWMGERRMQAENMTYLCFDEEVAVGPLQPQLAELATPKQPCRVCAEGALFIASVDRYNQLEMTAESLSILPRGVTGSIRRPHLQETFSALQLRNIEAAFECWESNEGYFTGAANRFGRRYKTPRTRMRAIMQNIIDNRGVFMPAPAEAPNA